MIILHAVYNERFVPNAEVVFKAHSFSGDYHGEMNHKMIVRWLEDKLIPTLPPKYVLVIDNATYHNVQVDRRPFRATIQEWLTKHGIQWSAGMLEDELLELCNTHPQVLSWANTYFPMTCPLPFIFRQSVARNGPFSAWYIFHNPHFCETHSHNLMRGNCSPKC